MISQPDKRPQWMQRNHGGLKLNAETQRMVVNALLLGNYREVAAASAGITRETLRNWMKRGEKEEQGIFRDFLEAVLKAEADVESLHVARISGAAKKDPQHSKWMLERKYPQRWARKQRLELTGAGGGPIEMDIQMEEVLKKMTVEELRIFRVIEEKMKSVSDDTKSLPDKTGGN